MKPGLILGLATGVPAFLSLAFGLGLPVSAIAALAVGIAVSIFWETLCRSIRSASGASILFWTLGGSLVGVAEAVAAALVSGERELGFGMILFVGSIYLGIFGAIVGAVLGAVLYARRREDG